MPISAEYILFKSLKRGYLSHVKSHINLILVYEFPFILWYLSSCGSMVGQIDWTVREACWFWYIFISGLLNLHCFVKMGRRWCCHELLSHTVCVLLVLNVQQISFPNIHNLHRYTGRAGKVDYPEFCLFIVFFYEKKFFIRLALNQIFNFVKIK